MHATLNSLPENERRQLTEQLNQALATLIDLSLQIKQSHWNVRGPRFIALHELFDAVYEVVIPLVDEVAERIAALGGTVQGTHSAVAQSSVLPAYPAAAQSGDEHVQAVSAALAGASNLARTSIGPAGDLGDEATADLYTEIVRELDKQLWFVEAHLHAEN